MSFPVRIPSRRARLSAPVLVAVALAGSLVALPRPASASAADEATLAALVNGARSSAGLAPLTVSGGLSAIARAHSASMAASGTLRHSGDLAGAVGGVVPGWTNVAENVGVAGSVTEAHRALLASAQHRSHILGDFTLVGTGVVSGADGRVWVTEVFARTTAVVAPAPAPAPVLEPVVALVPEPDPVPAPVSTVETTVTAAAVAPAPAPAAKPRVKPAKRSVTATATPARRAPAPAPAPRLVAEDDSCLPEHARGKGHAYGRCDDVPRGQGRGRP